VAPANGGGKAGAQVAGRGAAAASLPPSVGYEDEDGSDFTDATASEDGSQAPLQRQAPQQRRV
jgi:hypothetical protein